jgi:hypothetical protein
MDTKGILTACILDSTNNLLAQHDIPPILTDKVSKDALSLYIDNCGIPPGLESILRDKWAKAEKADEFLQALQDTRAHLRGNRPESALMVLNNTLLRSGVR